jgi:hypothetical protein
MDQQAVASAARLSVPRSTVALMKAAAVTMVIAALCVLQALPSGAVGTAEEAFRFTDPAIVESSGLAASVMHPGIVWTHNDSGSGPLVYAVDTRTGATVAVIRLGSVISVDVEAIAVGRDDAGRSALFVADTGTSVPVRSNAVIYRFTEPTELVDQSVDVTAYAVDLGQQPRPDVEALLVDPRDNRPYLISKDLPTGQVFQGPPTLAATGVNVFAPVAAAPAAVSDATFLPDGRVVVRNNSRVRVLEAVGGPVVTTIMLPAMDAGESVTLTPDGASLLLGREGLHSPVWRIPLGAHASAPSPTPQPLSPTTTPSPLATPAPTETNGAESASTASTGVDPSVQAGFIIAAVIVGALLIVGIRRRSQW